MDIIIINENLYVGIRSRNVKVEHLKEIFSHYGNVVKATLRPLRRGRATAEIVFSTESEANNAVYFMDAGVVDGLEIKVSFILIQHNRERELSPSKSFFWTPRRFLLV
jgi:hypothetical protein